MAKYDKVICFVNNNNYERISNVTYVFQPDIDVWIRDFGPIGTTDGLYQFIYKPDYISERLSKSIRESFKITTKNWNTNDLDLINDGGNFIHNGKIAIVTKKIYELNKNKSKEQVDEVIYNLGASQVIVLPYDKYDRTAHADGMVKWIDEERLFVGNFDDPRLTSEVRRILKAELPNDVQLVDIPCKLEIKSGASGWESVNGLYINYLQTKNAVYVPLYGLKEDDQVISIMKNAFRKPVEFLKANALAKHGGVINCASWNIKSELIESWLRRINVENGKL